MTRNVTFGSLFYFKNNKPLQKKKLTVTHVVQNSSSTTFHKPKQIIKQTKSRELKESSQLQIHQNPQSHQGKNKIQRTPQQKISIFEINKEEEKAKGLERSDDDHEGAALTQETPLVLVIRLAIAPSLSSQHRHWITGVASGRVAASSSHHRPHGFKKLWWFTTSRLSVCRVIEAANEFGVVDGVLSISNMSQKNESNSVAEVSMACSMLLLRARRLL